MPIAIRMIIAGGAIGVVQVLHWVSSLGQRLSDEYIMTVLAEKILARMEEQEEDDDEDRV